SSREAQCLSTKLVHADLEGHPRASGRLFKQQGHALAGQGPCRRGSPRRRHALRPIEHMDELILVEVRHAEEVPHARPCSTAKPSSTRSTTAMPSSKAASSTTSGGEKR